jgi:adenine-specific DNA-methyltransferase
LKKGIAVDQLKMQSPNLVDANIEKIAALFPNCITEDRDENGILRRAVDFDQLRQELSPSLVDGPQERYTLNWPGKNEAILTANAPIAKTLRPCEEESVDFEKTKNIYIEGDNLDALKLLQETYLNKIKMIYIDPPYNTGNDFLYNDNFSALKGEYEIKIGSRDEEGKILYDGEKWKQNSAANGRFHSDWLSMMYSRLKMAWNLLHEDGLIFLSIGQEEISNLRKIMDEIFGAENYRNAIAIKRGAKSVQAQFNTWDKLGTAFEYILFYSKSSTYRFPKMMRNLDDIKSGSWNNHWRGTDRPSMRYELFGIKPESGQWRWSKDRSLAAIENYCNMLKEKGKTKENIIQEEIDKWYIEKNEESDLLRLSHNGKPEHYIPPTDETLLNDVWFHLSSNGSSALKNLMGKKLFDNPKPIDIIVQVLRFVSDDSLVLDFFSGSATTANAVIQLNAEDNGNRKFIMVQLPELCNEKSEAYKAGYKNIAEIGKERIRRAGKKIKEENQITAKNIDTGFRVFKVDTSNMRDVYYTPDELKQGNLELFKDHIKHDRRPEDLLFQVFIDWGLELSLPITKESIDGKTVFFVDTNALIACFDFGITEELVKKLAKHKPLRAVFRDDAFGSDSVKINVEQIFRLLSPGTEVKAI